MEEKTEICKLLWEVESADLLEEKKKDQRRKEATFYVKTIRQSLIYPGGAGERTNSLSY